MLTMIAAAIRIITMMRYRNKQLCDGINNTADAASTSPSKS